MRQAGKKYIFVSGSESNKEPVECVFVSPSGNAVMRHQSGTEFFSEAFYDKYYEEYKQPTVYKYKVIWWKNKLNRIATTFLHEDHINYNKHVVGYVSAGYSVVKVQEVEYVE